MKLEKASSPGTERESLTEEDYESVSSGEEGEAEEDKVCRLLQHSLTLHFAFSPNYSHVEEFNQEGEPEKYHQRE